MTRLHKILAAVVAVAALCSLTFASPAQAKYPDGAITLVCPFGAGGAGDLAARILANAVKTDFPHPVVVANKPGAAGVVGTVYALNCEPDGYTMLAGRVANNSIIPALNKTIKYKWDDFEFIGLLDLNPLVFVVRKDGPYKTLQDLADAVKANPGKISFSTAGALNIQEVTAYMFLYTLGLNKSGAISVPFQSDSAGKNAIMGKHVDFGAINLSACFDQLGPDGQLRALAVTTPERLKKYPDIPTAREAGFPDLENILGWNAIFGLKGMPKEAINAWVAVLQKAKTNPDWIKNTENMGSIPYILPPEETKEFVREQVEKFEKLGQALDLTITK